MGLITYMRTDSTRVAGVAVEQARGWIAEEMGKEFVSKAPRYWTEKKQKGAQEAHEAIRPTDVTIHPKEVYQHLDDDQARLYELVWLRSLRARCLPQSMTRPRPISTCKARAAHTSIDSGLRGRW